MAGYYQHEPPMQPAEMSPQANAHFIASQQMVEASEAKNPETEEGKELHSELCGGRHGR